MADKTGTDPTTNTDAPAPVQKFRVVHAAVSGVIPDPKKPGQTREHDFYADSIVTDEQLCGNASQYVVLGAIVPVE